MILILVLQTPPSPGFDIKPCTLQIKNGRLLTGGVYDVACCSAVKTNFIVNIQGNHIQAKCVIPLSSVRFNLRQRATTAET
jgi:hypothetical protein